MPSRRRLFLFRGILLLGGLAFGFGMAELAVRLAVDIYEPDASLGWTFTPGKVGFKFARTREFAHPVRFNGHGLRDLERPAPKPAGTQRVLTLGDSFVAGLQVRFAETFQQRLEERLRGADAGARRFEVLNAGVDGYGTAQQTLLYEDRAHRYGAALVVLGLFAFNDVSDNSIDAGSLRHWLGYTYGRPYFVRDGEGLARRWRTGMDHWQLEGPLRRLLRRSMLYATFFPSPPGTAGLVPFGHADLFAEDPPPAWREAWWVTRAALRRLRDRAARDGAELLVALIPDRPTLRGERSNAGLAAELRAGGLRVLDLEPRLAEHPLRREGPLYFERDPHWNPRGHRAVAETLESWLREHCAELDLALPPCAP